jgi:hypothetical protein
MITVADFVVVLLTADGDVASAVLVGAGGGRADEDDDDPERNHAASAASATHASNAAPIRRSLRHRYHRSDQSERGFTSQGRGTSSPTTSPTSDLRARDDSWEEVRGKDRHATAPVRRAEIAQAKSRRERVRRRRS